MINIQTPLIHLNKKMQKNLDFFDFERNSQFWHLTEAVVNVVMPLTNETRLTCRTLHSLLTKQEIQSLS